MLILVLTYCFCIFKVKFRVLYLIEHSELSYDSPSAIATVWTKPLNAKQYCGTVGVRPLNYHSALRHMETVCANHMLVLHSSTLVLQNFKNEVSSS